MTTSKFEVHVDGMKRWIKTRKFRALKYGLWPLGALLYLIHSLLGRLLWHMAMLLVLIISPHTPVTVCIAAPLFAILLVHIPEAIERDKHQDTSFPTLTLEVIFPVVTVLLIAWVAGSFRFGGANFVLWIAALCVYSSFSIYGVFDRVKLDGRFKFLGSWELVAKSRLTELVRQGFAWGPDLADRLVDEGIKIRDRSESHWAYAMALSNAAAEVRGWIPLSLWLRTTSRASPN